MKSLRPLWPWLILVGAGPALAAPDEEALGKSAGYPAGRSPAQAYQEPYIVGSFSAMDSVHPSCALAPASEPLP